jgi:hypothetical protein
MLGAPLHADAIRSGLAIRIMHAATAEPGEIVCVRDVSPLAGGALTTSMPSKRTSSTDVWAAMRRSPRSAVGTFRPVLSLILSVRSCLATLAASGRLTVVCASSYPRLAPSTKPVANAIYFPSIRLLFAPALFTRNDIQLIFRNSRLFPSSAPRRIYAVGRSQSA